MHITDQILDTIVRVYGWPVMSESKLIAFRKSLINLVMHARCDEQMPVSAQQESFRAIMKAMEKD